MEDGRLAVLVELRSTGRTASAATWTLLRVKTAPPPAT